MTTKTRLERFQDLLKANNADAALVTSEANQAWVQHIFARYLGETTYFATKVLLFSHIRKSTRVFFMKKVKKRAIENTSHL